MAAPVGGVRRDPDMARLAIDNYLASLGPDKREDLHDRFEAALRDFDLARQIAAQPGYADRGRRVRLLR